MKFIYKENFDRSLNVTTNIMFERFFSKLLSNFLNKYFVTTQTNDDTSQDGVKNIELSVWSGYFTIDKLHLRHSLINNLLISLGLPLEIVSATIGQVQLTIPWSNLGDASVVIVIDRINVLSRLTDIVDFDVDAVKNRERLQRRFKLDHVNDYVKKSFSSSSSSSADSTSSSSSPSWIRRWLGESLINKVIDTVQVHVRDVSIRFEDLNSNSENPYTVGLTLESLHVKTDEGDDNNNSEDDNVSDSDSNNTNTNINMIKKIFQLNHMAIYWNKITTSSSSSSSSSSSNTALSKISDVADVDSIMNKLIARRSQIQPLNHTYLLNPINILSTVRIPFGQTQHSNHSPSSPLLTAHIEITSLNLKFHSHQALQASNLLNTMKFHQKILEYSKLRPKTGPMQSPREWWKYAISCVVIEMQKKASERSRPPFFAFLPFF